MATKKPWTPSINGSNVDQFDTNHNKVLEKDETRKLIETQLRELLTPTGNPEIDRAKAEELNKYIRSQHLSGSDCKAAETPLGQLGQIGLLQAMRKDVLNGKDPVVQKATDGKLDWIDDLMFSEKCGLLEQIKKEVGPNNLIDSPTSAATSSSTHKSKTKRHHNP